MVLERISKNVIVPFFFDGPFGNVFECVTRVHCFERDRVYIFSVYIIDLPKSTQILEKCLLKKKWDCLPGERFVNNYRNELLDVGKIHQ